ncbi:deoxyuridine 5'-triphosphate nucleotidohydrolase [Pseudomonas phage Ka3]|uniref:dUTP diphosphatase n=3 Tax=Luzseptimavirus TaxID=1982594 RepID=C8ZKI2_9CAUD|nr:hypothetical protein PP-LUZ7_gp083 [Pseudomonas phage LUZ7]YP_009218960.1 putative dUTPase [Pseudomonas phage KPP21]QKE55977.1 putative dUTPase protein [Pseudomonas phage vB_Pae_AM.P2]QWY17714.1 deoxyuridine 5'-triphosphate nucleotidohydrolase [Pseudomonas phage vB_Pae-PA152]UGL60883.1 deoxyuridine 5'-triphosphate nucleotidohydrolase [Pseudomonas phage vB_PaeS_TUMS_P6]UNI71965.1 deoxyuridine 5'-triphosphate nucleotidohydrolase [Pseudomonas phage vB_PaeP_TUMS_P10]WQZ52381.1 deoxyuridine 5'-
MEIKALCEDFIMPTRGSDTAGGFDIYMPEAGEAKMNTDKLVPLGFSTAIPPGFVALLLPRSGVGAKMGVRLRNTCGVIDADYRGEWMAKILTDGPDFKWEKGDRVLQFVIVPAYTPELQLVEELPETSRGEGGFGSTGKA